MIDEWGSRSCSKVTTRVRKLPFQRPFITLEHEMSSTKVNTSSNGLPSSSSSSSSSSLRHSSIMDHDSHFSKVIRLIPTALYRHTDCEDNQPDDDGDEEDEEGDNLPITNKYFQVCRDL